MIPDGYHHRAIQLLKEADWHLRLPSASESMPVHWDGHRFKVIERIKTLLDEMETEIRIYERQDDEQA